MGVFETRSCFPHHDHVKACFDAGYAFRETFSVNPHSNSKLEQPHQSISPSDVAEATALHAAFSSRKAACSDSDGIHLKEKGCSSLNKLRYFHNCRKSSQKQAAPRNKVLVVAQEKQSYPPVKIFVDLSLINNYSQMEYPLTDKRFA